MNVDDRPIRCISSRAAFLVLMLWATPKAEAQTDSRGLTLIEQLVARYDSAWNYRDTLTVSRLLAPRYQYFTSRGGVSSRAETLRFLIDPDYRLEQGRRSEIAVTMNGPVAVVSSRWQGQGTYRSERFSDDQRCGQVWVREGRGWQLLSEHCVQIAPQSPPPAG